MKPISLLIAFLVLMGHQVSQAEIVERQLVYKAEGTSMIGHLAYDSEIEEPRPGILVVHEWWGLNEYARTRARMLAELGYPALAIDMYGDGKVATHPDDARAFAGSVMKEFPAARIRFEAALGVLKGLENVDSSRIAAIGYCFGGGLVLNLARVGLDLDGVVSFHGSLAAKTPALKGEVKAKILVCNGEADSFVSSNDVKSFRTEMEQAGVDYRFESYPGAKHGFTNPDADRAAKQFNLDVAYNRDADRRSWQAMQEFLREIFS